MEWISFSARKSRNGSDVLRVKCRGECEERGVGRWSVEVEFGVCGRGWR